MGAVTAAAATTRVRDIVSRHARACIGRPMDWPTACGWWAAGVASEIAGRPLAVAWRRRLPGPREYVLACRRHTGGDVGLLIDILADCGCWAFPPNFSADGDLAVLRNARGRALLAVRLGSWWLARVDGGVAALASHPAVGWRPPSAGAR